MNIKNLNTLHGCYESNGIVRNGLQKGGGGGTTSTSGFAKEYKPQITEMLAQAKGAYESGELGKVAGFDDFQKLAHSRGRDVAGVQDSLAGQGRGAVNRLAELAGPRDLNAQRMAASMDAKKSLNMSNARAGARGGLGGSRQRLAQGALSNDLAAKFAGIDQSELTRQGAANQAVLQGTGAAQGQSGAGTSTLGQIGQARQQQSQNEADKTYKALNQYIGLFSGVAPKETSTKQDGGK